MKINRHHMIPINRGGRGITFNRLRMKFHRHEAFHRLYNDKTWQEIIHYLEFIRCTKAGHEHKKLRDFKIVWGRKNITEVVNLMWAIHCIKETKSGRICLSFSLS